jgi:alpha-tubulin suppressor-like RCC1 family protein
MPSHTVRPAIARLLLATFPGAVALALLSCGGKDSTTAPPPTLTRIDVAPGADTLEALGATRQFSATPRDAAGNALTGLTVVWRSSAPAVVKVDSSTGIATAVANGAATIQAVVGSVTGQSALTVAQAVATVVVTPGTTTLKALGATQPFTAAAQDANGNAVTGIKFLWVSSDQTVAIVDTNGLAQPRGPGVTTITASARGVPGNATLTVAQAARNLVFTVSPPPATAGEPFSTAVEVEVRDSTGFLVKGSRATITLGIGTTPGSDTVHGTSTVNAIGGIASFSGVWVDRAGNHTLVATSAGITGTGTSGVFAVGPGPSVGLAFAQQPVATGLKDTLPPVTAGVVDRFGNATSSGGGSVTLALAANPGNATLSGTKTVPVSGGVATFSDLSLDSLGTAYTLTASLAGQPSATSQAFDVTLNFTQMSTGFRHTCGVTPSQQTYCWGDNKAGELGDGTTTNRSLPTLVAGGHRFTAVAAGYDHTCALTNVGDAYCWGNDREGELGINSSNDTSKTPVAVMGGIQFTRLSLGIFFGCGLTSGGAAYCWGDNYRGQGGMGDSLTFNPLPTAVTGAHTFTSIGASSTYETTCGVASGGAAYCWGENTVGNLGTGTADAAAHPVPAAVTGGHVFSALSAGSSICALAGGAAYCWGDNSVGTIGIGSSDVLSHPTPVLVSGGLSFASISSGITSVCALTGAGAAYCWGSNTSGQLGDGTFVNHLTPGAITGFVFKEIVVGGGHACGRSGPRFGYCWGSNNRGQVGDGSTTNRATPLRVVP